MQPDGGLLTNHGGRYDDYIEAEDACNNDFGPLPTSAPLTDAELSKFYDLQVDSYECLVDHGYSPSRPPSREIFIATYEAEGSWEAHLPDDPGATYLESSECPRPSLEDIEW